MHRAAAKQQPGTNLVFSRTNTEQNIAGVSPFPLSERIMHGLCVHRAAAQCRPFDTKHPKKNQSLACCAIAMPGVQV